MNETPFSCTKLSSEQECNIVNPDEGSNSASEAPSTDGKESKFNHCIDKFTEDNGKIRSKQPSFPEDGIDTPPVVHISLPAGLAKKVYKQDDSDMPYPNPDLNVLFSSPRASSAPATQLEQIPTDNDPVVECILQNSEKDLNKDFKYALKEQSKGEVNNEISATSSLSASIIKDESCSIDTMTIPSSTTDWPKSITERDDYESYSHKSSCADQFPSIHRNTFPFSGSISLKHESGVADTEYSSSKGIGTVPSSTCLVGKSTDKVPPLEVSAPANHTDIFIKPPSGIVSDPSLQSGLGACTEAAFSLMSSSPTLPSPPDFFLLQASTICDSPSIPDSPSVRKSKDGLHTATSSDEYLGEAIFHPADKSSSSIPLSHLNSPEKCTLLKVDP
ncbi:unnamed protein product [Protopolystoma xenopodis]|uniref:Uncharacterized protein n=1 Tax=Protopolystoma xenopodis TaxID=117903 RepID=A0A3S5BES2_9PLAT|nr:unnamed protein product [Protopolystoma xenopodis]